MVNRRQSRASTSTERSYAVAYGIPIGDDVSSGGECLCRRDTSRHHTRTTKPKPCLLCPRLVSFFAALSVSLSLSLILLCCGRYCQRLTCRTLSRRLPRRSWCWISLTTCCSLTKRSVACSCSRIMRAMLSGCFSWMNAGNTNIRKSCMKQSCTAALA